MNTKVFYDKYLKFLQELKQHSHLVLSVTNYVTIEAVANMIIAGGGSPMMSDVPEDCAGLGKIANAINLNLGIMSKRTLAAMTLLQDQFYGQKPIIVDIVANGASEFRTSTIAKFLAKADVIKGNYGEISYLVNQELEIRGVDGVKGISNPQDICKQVALKYNKIIQMTGPIDYISDGKKTYGIDNGHELLSKVIGTGCMLSGLTALYLAHENSLEAVCFAALTMSLAADVAARTTATPQKFRTEWFDAIYEIEKLVQEKDLHVTCF